MTIENDIKTWATQRPAWQQDVLVALSKGHSYHSSSDIEQLADRILQPGSEATSKAAQDIVLGSVDPKKVCLTTVCNLKGVNALADDQTLTFASDGLTIIYGYNGSGKSGYARLVKDLVSARHSSKVLPNVFAEDPPEPSAEISYQVGCESASEKFPASEPIEDLQQIRFYDRQCGDEYLARESTINYRPSALSILDDLITVCDRVRAVLRDRITENQGQQLSLNLESGTTAATFVDKLSADTTDTEIDEATRFPACAQDNLGKVLEKVARLEASDVSKERARLSAASDSAKRMADHIARLTTALGAEQVATIKRLRDFAKNKREAARLAASNTFENEPLQGVGSQTWRMLWEAARAYATTEVDHEHEFPATGENTRCVLCQQLLDTTTKDRFERFHRYMTDTTQSDATKAERTYTNALEELRNLTFSTSQTTSDLATIQAHNSELEQSARIQLESLELHRDRILAHFDEGQAEVANLSANSNAMNLRELSASLGARAAAMDVQGFQDELNSARKERGELQSASLLARSVPALKSEVLRLRSLRLLNSARQATDTTGITRKATDLTTTYATTQLLEHFARETDRLSLRRVTLKDCGGQKGKVVRIPALTGAQHRDAATRAVLSEGEQTVLGLAGFFTEAEFDDSKSALVFDDPVTSLDHVRRGKVAQRLVEFAQERQVIVFTHDIAFVSPLLRNASSLGVSFECRTIEHRGDTPGHCTEGLPWSAQDVSRRLGTIYSDLERLKKDRASLTDGEYERRVCDLAGELSETWERAVVSEIVNRAYDLSDLEARPKLVRMLAKITDEDNREYQDGYKRVSEWALRHDKSEERNYVPPEPGEIEVEYKILKAWHKRIRSYQQ